MGGFAGATTPREIGLLWKYSVLYTVAVRGDEQDR